MRTPWCCSYFSFSPRRIETVSSTEGSPTNTGWKRRASAASFSTCLRYSSSVVAPTQCSSPRASAGFRRFEASMAPSALAGADERVHLVDEQDDAALGRRDLLQHRLEALLELAAVFRAGDEGAHVEGEELLVLEAFRHVAVDDAQRQALDDRGLADAGLADQHRDCSWCAGTGPGWCGGSPRRGRSPGRACRRAPPRSGRGRISSAPRRRSRPRRYRRCGPGAWR